MKKITVICDDLTGAMDTGVQLLNKGLKASVAIKNENMERIAGHCDAVIINTDSRNMEKAYAYGELVSIMEHIKDAGLDLVYKKIDSTLRGNLGAEMEAVLENSDFHMIAVAPALPFNKRTTINGFHYLNGRLITDSDLSKDPFSPVTSAYIPDIINKQASISVGVINIDDIRKGSEHLNKELSRAYSQGCRIIVMDGETTRDLDIIFLAINSHDLRILPCGSAGLFSRMYSGKEGSLEASFSGTSRAGSTGTIPGDTDPVLIVSGSPAKASKNQIKAAKKFGYRVIELRYNKKPINDIIKYVVDCLARGENVVLDAAGPGKEELYDEYQGDNKSLVDDSEVIQEELSLIILDVIEKAGLSGMVLIGGDTAVNVCRKLDAKGIEITGEVQPLIASGMLIGGKTGGIPIVTKAGGFGTEDVIIQAVNHIKYYSKHYRTTSETP